MFIQSPRNVKWNSPQQLASQGFFRVQIPFLLSKLISLKSTYQVETLMITLVNMMIFSLLTSPWVKAQETNDREFKFEIRNPAFPQQKGPVVCIDEAHHNVHTIDKLFAPFVQVMRADGFQPIPLKGVIDGTSLSQCNVLILGNGQANDMQSSKFWTYPHVSAYSSLEINSMVRWIRSGGNLLLFADHSPAAGSASGLAALLGVQLLNGWANVTSQGQASHPEVIHRSDGAMSDHPILAGRAKGEQINSLATYGSAAFYHSEFIKPILTFGQGANALVYLGDMGQRLSEIPQTEWPRYNIEGWLMGGSREWGEGRIVIFGDVTACTAQIIGSEELTVGMNHSENSQNHLFCLNMLRWLARAL